MKTFIFPAIILFILFKSPYENWAQSMTNEILTIQPETDNDYTQKNPEDSKWFWDFTKWNNSEGWTVSNPDKGVVCGGALWLSIQRNPAKAAR